MSVKLIMMLIKEHVYYNPDIRWIIFLFFLVYSIVVWVLLSLAVASAANRYSRLPIAYFLLSIIFSPLVGAAFLFASGPGRRYRPPAYSEPAAQPRPPTEIC